MPVVPFLMHETMGWMRGYVHKTKGYDDTIHLGQRSIVHSVARCRRRFLPSSPFSCMKEDRSLPGFARWSVGVRSGITTAVIAV